jgi:hypothetical protein
LIVIHGALVVADQAQPAGVAIVAVPGPPAAAKACVAGLTA